MKAEQVESLCVLFCARRNCDFYKMDMIDKRYLILMVDTLVNILGELGMLDKSKAGG